MQVNGGPPGLTRTSTRSLMAGNLHGGTGQRLTFPWRAEGDEFSNSLHEEWNSLKSFWNKTRDGGGYAHGFAVDICFIFKELLLHYWRKSIK